MNILQLLRNLTRLLLLTTLLFTSMAVFASNQTERLEQEALQFLSVHYNKSNPDVRTEININPISRSLNLKNCKQPIEFKAPKGNGSRITFKAACPSPLWRLFITAKIKRLTTAVISSQSLPKKTTLAQQHIRTKEVDVTNIRSAYFKSTADLSGWTTKRNIPEGTLITASMLRPPVAVRKGYSVIIEAIRNGISIKATGTALEDGEVGKQIKVENARSGRIIKAEVIKPGLVRTP